MVLLPCQFKHIGENADMFNSEPLHQRCETLDLGASSGLANWKTFNTVEERGFLPVWSNHIHIVD